MAGTVAGNKKSAATNKARYGDDFYKRIGALGSVNSHGPYYFATRPDVAQRSGRVGGSRGKRGYRLLSIDDDGTATYQKNDGSGVLAVKLPTSAIIKKKESP